MKIKIILITFFISQFFYSQVLKRNDTINDPNKLSLFSADFESRTPQLISQLESHKIGDQKTISSLIKIRKKIVLEFAKNQYIYFDEESEKYLNDVFQKLLLANKIPNQNLKIYINRETNPNAFSIGDGIFFINISLICKMDNVDELYFVFSHELSHYLLDHFEKTIVLEEKSLSTYKKKSKNITKKNKFEQSISAMKDYTYFNKNSSRRQEKEADSLGFVLFKNVSNNDFSAEKILTKFDSISPIEIAQIDLDDFKKEFQTNDLKFNDDWIDLALYKSYYYRNGRSDVFGLDRDSVATHPEITERIQILKKQFRTGQNNLQTKNNEFSSLKLKMINQNLMSYYLSEEYGKGLYYSLQLEKINLASDFEKNLKSIFYEKLYESRKNHSYKKYVDDVDISHQTKNYSMFLSILENLSLSDLLKLKEYYKHE